MFTFRILSLQLLRDGHTNGPMPSHLKVLYARTDALKPDHWILTFDHGTAVQSVGEVLEAEHLCMSQRGVRAQGSRTVTSALRGLLRDDARTRQEFFALTGVGRKERTS